MTLGSAARWGTGERPDILSLLNSNNFNSHVPRPSHEARTGSGVCCLCVSGHWKLLCISMHSCDGQPYEIERPLKTAIMQEILCSNTF